MHRLSYKNKHSIYYWEIITVNTEKFVEHINAQCGQQVKSFNLTLVIQMCIE
jgi:hypothetical protein